MTTKRRQPLKPISIGYTCTHANGTNSIYNYQCLAYINPYYRHFGRVNHLYRFPLGERGQPCTQARWTDGQPLTDGTMYMNISMHLSISPTPCSTFYFILFIKTFNRNTLKAVINNDDVKDAQSMVITGYKTANVTPLFIIAYKYIRTIIIR